MATIMINDLERDVVDAFPEHASSATQYEFLFRYTAYAAIRVVGFSWFPLVGPNEITFSMIHTENRSGHGRATLIAIGAALATLRVATRRFGRTAAVHLFPDPTRPSIIAHATIGELQPPSLDDRLRFNVLTAPIIRSAPDTNRPLPQGLLHAVPHIIARDGMWTSAVAAASDRMRVRDCARQAMQAGAMPPRGIAPITRDELVGPLDMPTPGLFLLGVNDREPASMVMLGEALQDLVTLLRLHEVPARIVPMDPSFGEQVADALALPRVPQFMVLGAYEAPRL